MPKSIRVQNIDHVTIVVKSLKASRDFYVDLLGMDEVQRPAFSFPGAWYQAGSTLLHLIEEHEQSGLAGTGASRSHNSRCHHFAFEVADATAAAECLKEQGVELVHDAKLRPDGAVQVFLADPDGHVIELCTSSAVTT